MGLSESTKGLLAPEGGEVQGNHKVLPSVNGSTAGPRALDSPAGGGAPRSALRGDTGGDAFGGGGRGGAVGGVPAQRINADASTQ